MIRGLSAFIQNIIFYYIKFYIGFELQFIQEVERHVVLTTKKLCCIVKVQGFNFTPTVLCSTKLLIMKYILMKHGKKNYNQFGLMLRVHCRAFYAELVENPV